MQRQLQQARCCWHACHPRCLSRFNGRFIAKFETSLQSRYALCDVVTAPLQPPHPLRARCPALGPCARGFVQDGRGPQAGRLAAAGLPGRRHRRHRIRFRCRLSQHPRSCASPCARHGTSKSRAGYTTSGTTKEHSVVTEVLSPLLQARCAWVLHPRVKIRPMGAKREQQERRCGRWVAVPGSISEVIAARRICS